MLSSAMVDPRGGKPFQIKECLINYQLIVTQLTNHDPNTLQNMATSLQILIELMKVSPVLTAMDGKEDLIATFDETIAESVRQMKRAEEERKR